MFALFKRRGEGKNHESLSTHFAVGKTGEEIAARYLLSLPYQVKARNVKVGKHDEIDIIAYDPSDDVMVFIEVKSRARFDEDFRPERNVTRRKQEALWRAARRWIVQHKLECGYRVDVVCVAGGQVVDHFKEIRRPNQR